MGVDETVLWSGSMNTTGVTVLLNDRIDNYTKYKVYTHIIANGNERCPQIWEYEPYYTNMGLCRSFASPYNLAGGTDLMNVMYFEISGYNTFKLQAGTKYSNGSRTGSLGTYDFEVTKIVGVGKKV